MASKGGRDKIKLESTAGTGHFYTTTKNKRTKPEKMEIMKFDTRKPRSSNPLDCASCFRRHDRQQKPASRRVFCCPSFGESRGVHCSSFRLTRDCARACPGLQSRLPSVSRLP